MDAEHVNFQLFPPSVQIHHYFSTGFNVLFLLLFSSNYFLTPIVTYFEGYVEVYFISFKCNNFLVTFYKWFLDYLQCEQETYFI